VLDYARNGAALYQIGSALVSEGIGIFERLKAELKVHLGKQGYTNVGELMGAAHRR
jgi:dihydroorotate dehydrogenase